MKKFIKKILKFSAAFMMIVVFAFSNFVSFLPEILQQNKLAESLKIKEARAASPNGLIFYSSSVAATTPQTRTYTNGAPGSFSAATALPVQLAANSTQYVIKAAPTRNEYIAGVMDNNNGGGGDLNIYRFNGASWVRDWTVSPGSNAISGKKSFDISYELTTGRAMVVYSGNTAAPQFRIWDGTAWSAAQSITVARTTGVIHVITLASREASNEIAIAYYDANSDLNVKVWRPASATDIAPASWVAEPATLLEGTVASISTHKPFDIAFERASGDLVIFWLRSAASGIFSASLPTAGTTWATNAAAGTVASLTELDAESDPLNTSNNIAVCASGANIECTTWTGAAFSNSSAGLDTTLTAPTGGSQGIAVGWAGTQIALAAYIDKGSSAVNFITSTNGGVWTVQTDFTPTPAMTGDMAAVRIVTSPISTNKKLMLLSSDKNFALRAETFNGATASTVWINDDGGSLGTLTSTVNAVMDFAWDRFTAAAITTIADGTDPANSTIAPSGAITYLDAFTLATNTGTDSVTALTVTLTGASSFESLSEVRITSDNGATLYFAAVANPASNTVSFSAGTPIPVSTAATQFKVRITPKTHAAMPAPPGLSYAVGGTVTAFTSTNAQAGSDAATPATITIDNLSPASATLTSGSAGNAQVTLNWTTSSSESAPKSVVLRWTAATAGAEVPAEGAFYGNGAVIGAATVVCARTDLGSTAVSGIDGAGTGGCSATALTNGQAYSYKIFQQDFNGNYDVGGVLIGTFTPIATLTIGVTTGVKIANRDSGATLQFAHDITCTLPTGCAAFTLSISSGSETITSIKITETGTTAANTNLSNLALFTDTNGNWADAEVEAQYGTTVAAFDVGQAANVVGSLVISSAATQYFYVRFDLVNGAANPAGGETVNFQIAANADVVTVGAPTKTGSPVTLAGTTTFRPNATSTTFGAGETDGGRSGESITISGFGFGVAPALSRANCIGAVDTGCVRFTVGGAATVIDGDVTTWSNTSIAFTINAAIATEGGAAALEVVAGSQADATKLPFFVYPKITDVTNPTAATNAAREFNASDSDGIITVSGNHFGTAGTVTVLTVTATQQTTAICTVTAYQATCVGIQIPTAIANNSYLGNIVLTRTSDSKTDTFGGGAYRILPRIISTGPVNLKAGQGDTGVSIAGDHLCQSGTCPIAFSVADSANFTGGSVTTGASAWTHTSVPSITIPATAIDGALNVISNTSYTSNNLTYDIKFAPATPTNSAPANLATGVSQTPTLTSSVFSDGTDGDIHIATNWRITKTAGDYTALQIVWTRTSVAAETTIIANAANSDGGAGFTNIISTTQLNCGTTYFWQERYRDTSGVVSQEFSLFSAETSFTTLACGPNATSSATSPAELTDGSRIGQTVVITGSTFGAVAALSRANCVGGAGTGCIKINGVGGYTLADGDISVWTDTSITLVLPAAVTGYGGLTTSGLIVYAAGVSDPDGLTFYIYPDITSITAPLGANTGAREFAAVDTDGIITIFGNKFGTAPTGGSVVIVGGTVATFVADVSCDAVDGFADTCIKVQVPTTIVDTTDSGFIIITQGTGANAKTTNATDAQGALNVWPRVIGFTNTTDATLLDGGRQTHLVTVSGNHFGATAGSITINGIAQDGTPTWGGASIIGAGVPDTGADSGSVVVTKLDTKTSNAFSTFYIYPQITGFTAGQTDGDIQTGTITITGNHFGATGAVSNIIVNGVAPVTIGVWSATSIPAVDIPNTGTDSGTITVTRASDTKASNASATFYIYPQITGLTPCAALLTDTAREFAATDTVCANGLKDGEIHVNGNHLGSVAGSLTILTVSAPTYASWGASLISTIQVPVAIADTSYTGAIVLTRSDTKPFSFAGFRILPRITSLNPVSGTANDSIIIIGNHLCQTGACPLAGFRSVAADNVTFFSAVQVTDANVTVWGHGDSSLAGVTANVPTAAITGNIVVTSNTYASNGVNFTKQSTVPNSPSVLQQYETDGTTVIAVGNKTKNGATTNLTFKALMTGFNPSTLCLQIENAVVGTAFSGIITAEEIGAACKAYSGTAVTGVVTITGLTATNGYHWRARVKNSSTLETSAWVAFGGNLETDNDYYIDTTAPVISAILSSAVTASGATITWTTDESSDSKVMFGATCIPGTGTAVSQTAGVTSHSVVLSGLSSNTTYQYQAVSQDRNVDGSLIGNSATGPTSTTCNTFITSKANTKTLEYFITSETGAAITAEISRTFTATITETGYVLQDVFVELNGIAAPVAGSASINLRVYKTGATPPAYGAAYSVPVASIATPFTILFKIVDPTANLNIAPTQAGTNTLDILPPVSGMNIASAKIIITYYAPPQ